MSNNNNNRPNPASPYLSDNARNALFDNDGIGTSSRKWGGGRDQSAYSNMSNREILDGQKKTMDDQDKHLDSLSHSIGRTKEMAIEIGKTAEDHSRMLDELDVHVDSTSARLSNATRSVISLARETKTTGYWVTICLLFLALIVVSGLAATL
ncbi:hypothetical protein CYY_003615 [Polysphondylium violaceum]|uniref:t-SNARE coiled-coil homology domain-containing protein n=1 Tax=Polysphondylium violaceum TaxID=133409 RepID=A0A8J4PXG8_9MYCE|nr:hypothetical protein CYY_003615 [Polysphondylium violaceum]